MCGIAGILANNHNGPAKGEQVRRMCDLMVHRGPDDSGLLLDGPVALGHRRLSIIDLSPDAAQPMSNEDHSIALIINGEIYNFKQLRSELEGTGHQFRTQSDSEVVIHLYEDHGLNFLHRLRGMFALALWDSQKQRLILARDPFGKKPLFYYNGPRGFIFASELQAMARSGVIPLEPELEAIDAYLALQYVPSPMTIYQGVRKLPPGHSIVSYPGRTGNPERYHRLRFDRRDLRSMPEVSSELLRRIKESVRIRMVSDVPLGAFLSGGIDSSLVVACLALESSKPIKTFTIGFPNADQSELVWARNVAEQYGTDHHEMVVEPEMVSVIPDLVLHYGEPYGDTSAVPTWYLSRFTRQRVTVALSGDGGDEAFGGYRHYSTIHATNMFNRLPNPLPKLVGAVLQRFSMPVLRPLRDFGRRVIQPELLRYLQIVAHFPSDERRGIYSAKLKRLFSDDWVAARLQKLLDSSTATGGVNRFLELEVQTYLPDDILAKVDIASMAHSLEVRCPFMDKELMAFAAALPLKRKLSSLSRKIVLRKAAVGLVPRSILKRPKMGFDIPVDRWMREDLAPMARDILLDQTASQRDLFNPRAVADLLERHRNGESRGQQIWTLLLLEQWFRTFMDRSPA